MAISGVARAAGESDTWFLNGARILVAPDAAPIDDGVVVVRGGKILAVGKKSEIEIPAGARESSCTGRVVMAGFQNSHVHFLGVPFKGAGTQTPAALGRSLSDMLSRFGFTTVVDTASDRSNTLAIRARIDSGEVPGPRILTVGLPLFPANGLPFYAADLPKPMLDPRLQPSAPDDAVKVVRENLDAGADATKLFIATPQRDRSVKRMSGEIASAAADETHRRGKWVMAHPTDIDGVRAAMAAGVDVLVHTTLDNAQTWPDSLVRELVARHIAVVPTLKLWGYELHEARVPDAISQKLVAATLVQLKAFSDAGGEVLFGTDVGYMTDVDPTEEYELMAKAGLTPMQILASLTTAPASRWKESERRGRIAVGMDADLVVLDADPASDARNFAKVACAVRGGSLIYKK